MLSQLIDKIDNFIIVHCTAQCAVPPEARLSVDSSAQLPAKREGEEKLFSITISYPTTLPSPQKETAELCPGCDCLIVRPGDRRPDLQRLQQAAQRISCQYSASLPHK